VPDVLRDCHRIAVAGLTLTTRSVRSSPGGEAGGTVRAGPDSTEHEIDLNAGDAQALRDAPARQARGPTRRCPAVSPGRNQDTDERGGRHRSPRAGKDIEMKHRGRLPAEPVAEFKASTGQQTPGHPSRHGYAISRSCRCEYRLLMHRSSQVESDPWLICIT
jgi:hypothetical protein